MSFVGKNASPKKCVSHFPISDDLSLYSTQKYFHISFLSVATRKNEKERLDFAIETYEKFVAGELSKNEFVKTVGKWWMETSNLQ
jgi:hypothetical protein